jgi:hypothetical protein
MHAERCRAFDSSQSMIKREQSTKEANSRSITPIWLSTKEMKLTEKHFTLLKIISTNDDQIDHTPGKWNHNTCPTYLVVGQGVI